VPPEAASVPEKEPHHQRQAAESFGSDPGRYDRARPRYPDALIERIVAGAPGGLVLDVAVGTGAKAAEAMQATGAFDEREQWRFEWVHSEEEVFELEDRARGFDVGVELRGLVSTSG
jgi:ubiquinone/menaquinone biosynthesis C-methylase UbiE